MDRHSIGCDTNPVAYCITRAKTNAPSPGRVMNRIAELQSVYKQKLMEDEVSHLPTFFHHAYHPATLHQLVFLRGSLQHRKSIVDGMSAALILGSLHGEADRSDGFLSNQMPHTISTKPDYSVCFWKRHECEAPERDAFELLRRQLLYRYESKRPSDRGLVFH